MPTIQGTGTDNRAISSTGLTNLPLRAVIGAGAMGGALVRGLLNADVRVGPRIRITAPRTARVQEFTDLYDVQDFDPATDPEAHIKAVDGAGVVVLAVKPEVTPEVLKDIAGAVRDGAVIISIAAGVTLSRIESLLPETVIAIRAMPKAPALAGRGVTCISPGSRGSIQDVALADRPFRTVGTVLTIPETLIDELTSISGSGPAYVFFLIEQLTAAAEPKGFTPEQAALLVNGTFRGARELMVG